jgi:ankyrin repeat protein
MSETGDEQADWYERERLHRAAESGDLKEIKALLADGSPIGAFDDLSHTPLHRAAIAGDVAAVRYLLQAGADVNAHEEDRIGDTVLKTVASNCTLEMARILLEAGADPTIPGWMMLTALDKSAERKKPEGKNVHRLLVAAAKRLNPNWSRLPKFATN